MYAINKANFTNHNPDAHEIVAVFQKATFTVGGVTLAVFTVVVVVEEVVRFGDDDVTSVVRDDVGWLI